MPVKRSVKIAINKRREHVADLYLQGWTQCAIADEVGVGQPTISSDLQRIQKQWRESAVRDFDLAREVEIQKIDRIEREAWGAWERSKKPSQTAITTDETHQRKTRRHVKNQYGDPRFLEQVNKCIASRRALLGLDAPSRMEIETDGANPEQRRDRVVTILAALRERRGTPGDGELSGDPEPRLLCTDSKPGTLESGQAPRLPGPGDR
ncbi:helix-turn-helix domain-containing protein [Bythopirellula polymerisocia]|uniref:helix-turn-helix domain-containing protein n=1 Tax=Bythopirellula polymerisocia TaxID=2528003 RepID=UPI0018D47C87|nr:helix-turn-helix domain-containing protein [Bythopirellula polymerisocia]